MLDRVTTSPPIPKARQLTAGRLKEVLRYDPETGVFTWRISRPGCVAGRVAGTKQQGYCQIEIDRKLFRAARLAWLYMNGEFPEPGLCVDHINGVRDDDRWCNLRLATPAQNCRNRGLCRRNTSGHIGVHPIKASGLWGAEISVNGRNVRLGAFECKEEAIAARCKAERHYFGDFARRVADV